MAPGRSRIAPGSRGRPRIAIDGLPRPRAPEDCASSSAARLCESARLELPAGQGLPSPLVSTAGDENAENRGSRSLPVLRRSRCRSVHSNFSSGGEARTTIVAIPQSLHGGIVLLQRRTRTFKLTAFALAGVDSAVSGDSRNAVRARLGFRRGRFAGGIRQSLFGICHPRETPRYEEVVTTAVTSDVAWRGPRNRCGLYRYSGCSKE